MNILTRTQTHKTFYTNWTFFRDNLTTLMNNTIPHCNTKAKTHLPWISRELIRMQRRRNKSHKKANQTGLNKHWEQFRELRRQTTKALATSYKSYVNNQIGDSLHYDNIRSRLLPAQPNIHNTLYGSATQLQRTATYNTSAMNRRDEIVRSLGDQER